MKIQLLTFLDCPNAGPARDALREALHSERVDASVEEIDIGHDAAPAALRAWGSPTILIDGADVTGAKPSAGEIGCRLYAGGTPSVAQIRAALRGNAATGARWPLIGAIGAAVAASACCIVPAVLAIVGLSGAGVAATMAPLRPYFLLATALALITGLWLAYRRSPAAADTCGCALPRRRRWTRSGLWFGAALAIAITAYPYLYDSTAAATRVSAQRGVAEVRLHVEGMDCRACATTLVKKLGRVPGVVNASVDYDAKLAIISHDGTRDLTRDLLDATEDLGYHGSPTGSQRRGLE